MRKMLLSLMVLVLVSCLSAQVQPLLQLDTGGHTATIRDVIKASGLVTAGDDKTIRVWNVPEGRATRQILGEIGEGDNGKIYAIAVSPNGKYLAAGGYFPDDEIRLYDFHSGKMLNLLKAHTNVVNDLAFTPDGNYLISVSSDNAVRLWNMDHMTDKSKGYGILPGWDDCQKCKVFNYHRDRVNAVKTFGYGNETRIVTVGNDKRIVLASVEKGYINGYFHSATLDFVAVSDQYIFASSWNDNAILIFDLKLNLKKTGRIEGISAGLAVSPGSRYLLTGAGKKPWECAIWDIQNNLEPVSVFAIHENSAFAVTFWDEQTAVTAGGNNNEICLWDIQTGELKQRLAGNGRCIWSVGILGDRIAFGTTPTKNPDAAAGKLEKLFDLKTHTVDYIAENQDTLQRSFHRIITQRGKNSLTVGEGGDFGYPNAVLKLIKNNRVASQRVRGSNEGYAHNCFSYVVNDYDWVISGGGNGFLQLYDSKLNLEGEHEGQTGEIWAVAVEGNRILSGGEDQTLKLWTRNKKPYGARYNLPVNIFVSNDNEWVIWTNQGYYTGSPNGVKYLGWHVNQGPDKEALFITASQLFGPGVHLDLIQEALRGNDVSGMSSVDFHEILLKEIKGKMITGEIK